VRLGVPCVIARDLLLMFSISRREWFEFEAFEGVLIEIEI